VVKPSVDTLAQDSRGGNQRAESYWRPLIELVPWEWEPARLYRRIDPRQLANDD
jgi:hypothetical protein